MFHGFKVSMSKGTNKKNIIRDDGSLSATQTTLMQWKSSLESLQYNLKSNEDAWQAVLGSYTALETVGASLYATHDVDAHSCLKDLSNAQSRLESPPSGVEPHSNAVQRMENSKGEINDVVARIANVLSLHGKRIETIRQFKYYDSKTKQMYMSDSKRRSPSSTKEVERLNRNQKKTQDISLEIANLTSQIHLQMEQIELDKLDVTDRAISALILSQRQIFDSNPVRDAVMKADKIGMGKRVPPREDQRPWVSESTYEPPAAPMPQPPQGQQGPAPGQTAVLPGQQPPPPAGVPMQPVPPPAPQPQHPPPTVPDPQNPSVSAGYQMGQQYSTPVYSQGPGTNGMPQNYSAQSYESQPSAPIYENESFRTSARYSSPPPPPISAAQPIPPLPVAAPPSIPGQPAPPSVPGVPAAPAIPAAPVPPTAPAPPPPPAAPPVPLGEAPAPPAPPTAL